MVDRRRVIVLGLQRSARSVMYKAIVAGTAGNASSARLTPGGEILPVGVIGKAGVFGLGLHTVVVGALGGRLDVGGDRRWLGADQLDHGSANACLSKVSLAQLSAAVNAERVGRNDTVIKILPPLTTEAALLERGCSIIKRSIVECIEDQDRA